MSVNMSVGDYSFFIPVANKEAARAAAMLAFDWDEKVEKGHCFHIDNQIPETLEQVLAVEDWLAKSDEDGNIDNLVFYGDTMCDSFKLFEAIAPFVQAGSYLCVILDNDPVRWFFDGNVLLEKMPTYD